jgi:hypothetical protein
MTKFKRILIFAVIILLLSLYGIAFYFSIKQGKNSPEIIVLCIASICVISVFIGILIKIFKK